MEVQLLVPHLACADIANYSVPLGTPLTGKPDKAICESPGANMQHIFPSQITSLLRNSHRSPPSMTKELIGISCIHVGTGKGGTISMLARVAVIDRRGQALYDTYVEPTSEVVSYRTATTGLDSSFFVGARPFGEVQLTVARWIENKVIVGHQLWLDLQILGLSHPAIDTRDVALFLPFRLALRRPNDILGLQTLMWLLMRRKIQEQLVDPLENARAAIDLYRSHEAEWQARVDEKQWPCALPPQAYSRCFT